MGSKINGRSELSPVGDHKLILNKNIGLKNCTLISIASSTYRSKMMKWIKNHVAKSCNAYFYNKSMITYNIVDKVMNATINEGNALLSINIYSDFGIEQNSGLQGSRNLIIRK